jgi:hypothetical protein
MSSPVARATRCHLLWHATRDVISCGTRHAMSSPVARATRCHLLWHAPRDVISCGTRHAMSSPGARVRSVPPDTTCRLARNSRHFTDAQYSSDLTPSERILFPKLKSP